jgi:hypothetical protein
MAAQSVQDQADIVRRFEANSQTLADLVNQYGPGVLPSGYTLRVTSQDRPHATVKDTGGVSQHALSKAIDFAIRDPQGNLVPNYKTEDTTGLYRQVATAVRDQLPANLQSQLAWGGNFGIRDLMHLDFGGDRGALGTLSGGAPHYVASPDTGFKTGLPPADAATPSLGSTVAGQGNLDPALGRTTDLSLPANFNNAAPARSALAMLTLQGAGGSSPLGGPASMADAFSQVMPQAQQPQTIQLPPTPPGAPLAVSRRLG